MSANGQTGTVTTYLPARLDRLPWSRLTGASSSASGVWILDGLDVAMVGNVSSRLTEKSRLTCREPGGCAS